jgi:hypothetical protein
VSAGVDDEFSFAIDLPARNEWSNVEVLRTSVLSCFTAMFRDVERCQALAMITGELLENAVKYGDWARERSHFRLRVWGAEGAAHVQVENPIAPESKHLARLLETISWLKGFPTAEEAYRARLLEIAASTTGGGEGTLGLARVAYEGSCTLAAKVDPPGVLCVTADLTVA